jgi:GR25 family glycosyltransferase involved in LPS biosynthesis
MLLEINNIMTLATPQTADVVVERTKNRMKAYIISMINDHDSTVAARRVLRSIFTTESKIDPLIFPAVTPADLDKVKRKLFGKSAIPNISYTYPKTEAENRYDIKSGLHLSAYANVDLNKRIACFLSHYTLWLECYKSQETIMILEHDAYFAKQFDWASVSRVFTGDVLGLNSPKNTTRKAELYDERVKKQIDAKYAYSPKRPDVSAVEVPWLDDHTKPHGLAGNSAYVIKPEGALKLIQLTAEHGMWPNDAIMCKQLMPGKLQQVYPYITKVQGLKSTTSE